jgi:hypothetical protein
VGPKLAAHSGRLVKTTGEGFHTVLDEMVWASEMQAGSANTMRGQRNAFDLRAALVKCRLIPELRKVSGEAFTLSQPEMLPRPVSCGYFRVPVGPDSS